MKIKKPNYFKEKNGSLTSLSLKKNFPIKCKRIFFLYTKKNDIRGKHAHKKCSQYIFPLIGTMQLKLISKKGVKKKILKQKNLTGYLLKPFTWVEIKFLSKHNLAMVICDKEYDSKDYIRNFIDFKKKIKIN